MHGMFHVEQKESDYSSHHVVSINKSHIPGNALRVLVLNRI